MKATTITGTKGLPAGDLRLYAPCPNLDTAAEWATQIGAAEVFWSPLTKQAFARMPEVKQPHPASLETWTAEDIIKREG